MGSKRCIFLVIFALFGMALWFFGNLYEAVVIAPNLLVDSTTKAHAWQVFFTVTNPVFFYVPLGPLAVVAMIILYIKMRSRDRLLERYLRIALIFGLSGLLLGVYIITQINLKLFFGNIEELAPRLHGLAVQWNILNGIRVGCLLVVIIYLFKSYNWLVVHKKI